MREQLARIEIDGFVGDAPGERRLIGAVGSASDACASAGTELEIGCASAKEALVQMNEP